jgi:hypothetical protein
MDVWSGVMLLEKSKSTTENSYDKDRRRKEESWMKEAEGSRKQEAGNNDCD